MKFTLTTLATVALAGSAAAHAADHPAPYTIANRAAAQSSVLAAMAAQKPKSSSLVAPHSSSASAKPAATSPAKTTPGKTSTMKTQVKTTSHAATSKPSTKKPSTTTHHATATTTAPPKHERRDLLQSILGIITNIPIPTQACASVPNWGFNYVPTVNSPAGFLNDTTMYTNSLAGTAPAGYVWNWAGLYTAVVSPYYIGYAQMSSYNVSACAAYCDSTTGCQGFDMYYERDPLVWPGAGCLNPNMQTGIHCALYSTKLNYTNAINIGQWNGNFAVVIAGANGYSKVNATSTPLTTTTTASAANNFTIQSAYFADHDITALAKANFLVNDQLVVNTSYPSAALGTDPWPANAAKTITILYTYNGEQRVFNAVENTGVYTQLASSYSTTSAPGSSLCTSFLPTNGANFQIVGVTYGGVQITSSAVYLALYASLFTGLPFVVSDLNMGVTSLSSIFSGSSSSKSLVIWYKSSGSSTVQSITARQSSLLTLTL